jgi:hypothetical protein
MAGKESGIGDFLFLDAIDLSGDIGSVTSISSPFNVLGVTDITQSAPERLAGEMDGAMAFSSWFNPDSGRAHEKLSALPRTNVQGSYFHRGIIGNPAASLTAIQVGYDPNRGQDGSLAMATSLTAANGTPLEWGVQLTAGKRTDTAATNGSSLDQTTVSTSFGWQAYLHVFSFTGTSVTITIQDSANNSAFTSLTGGAFTTLTAAGKERIAGGATATVRRYVRVITAGTFSSCVFAVNFIRNLSATT